MYRSMGMVLLLGLNYLMNPTRGDVLTISCHRVALGQLGQLYPIQRGPCSQVRTVVNVTYLSTIKYFKYEKLASEDMDHPFISYLNNNLHKCLVSVSKCK